MAWARARFTLEAISRRITLDTSPGIISPGIIFSAIVRISADGHGGMADGHGGMATTIGRPMHTAITRHPRSQSHLNENHPAQRASIVSKLSRFRQKMAEQQRLGFYAARKGRMRLSPHYRYSRETVLSIVGGAELYCELANAPRRSTKTRIRFRRRAQTIFRSFHAKISKNLKPRQGSGRIEVVARGDGHGGPQSRSAGRPIMDLTGRRDW